MEKSIPCTIRVHFELLERNQRIDLVLRKDDEMNPADIFYTFANTKSVIQI